MQQLIVITGAGISAESGIRTFRDAGGLWEGHDIYEVASPEGWAKNRGVVLDFYNQRRKQLLQVTPNAAHYALAALEKEYDVSIITQNVDDLHERAGSTKVLHLHGELRKVRSTRHPELVYTLEGWELKDGDLCEAGAQLRPHIVWFGEEVPLIETAALLCEQADLLVVIGTSLQVYPAAGLLHYAPADIPKYLIDPHAARVAGVQNLTLIPQVATEGMLLLQALLKEE